MSFNPHFGLEGTIPTLMYVGMFICFLLSIFWRPTLGLYVVAFALPLQTARYKLQEFFLGAHFLDILLLGTVIGLLVKREKLIPKTPLAKFLLILAIFYYFSLWEGSFFIDAPLPIWISDSRFSDWKNYVEMFFLALLVASALKEKRQIAILLITMCLSILLVNRSFYSTMNGRDLSHFSYDVRDAGVLGYAGVNGLAAFEAMTCSFLLAAYAFSRKILAKLGLLLFLSTCVYCLLFAFSRGGYVGLLVGMVAIGILKARKFLLIPALLILSWQTLLPTSVQERINMTTADAKEGDRFDSSAQDRITLWEDAIDLFKRNPVTGSGFDTYGSMGRVGGYRDTHNYYIKVLAETGVVGLLLYLALLLRLFKSGLSLFTKAEDPFWGTIGLGFVAVMTSAAILNFFGDRWTYQQVDGYLWILLGCVIRGLMAVESGPSETQERSVETPHEEMELASV